MDKQDGSIKAPSGIQSLERAFAIIETIARNPAGISLTELGRQVGLHSSTTFHLVKTMMTLGYVRQAEDSKRYRIGGALFHLAAAALDEVELVGLADPFVRTLARETGETCHFAIRGGDEIVIIAKSEGAGVFQISDRVGGTRPAYCTALGKIILAALRPMEIDYYLGHRELKAYTSNTLTDPTRLRGELDKIRASGIAFDDAEYHSELRCIAAPVRDFTSQVIGALGVSGPIWRTSLQILRGRAEITASFAKQLSETLGFRAELAPDAHADDHAKTMSTAIGRR